MDCSGCGNPCRLVDRTATYRRGQRTVEIKTQCWSCPTECVGPSGERPFEFYDVKQLKANDASARAEWYLTYGEKMPQGPLKKKPT
jgi:hypothetical protein